MNPHNSFIYVPSNYTFNTAMNIVWAYLLAYRYCFIFLKTYFFTLCAYMFDFMHVCVLHERSAIEVRRGRQIPSNWSNRWFISCHGGNKNPTWVFCKSSRCSSLLKLFSSDIFLFSSVRVYILLIV